MRDAAFDRFRDTLLRRGVAYRHASRVTIEVREHFQDLVRDLEAEGLSADDASSEASRRLGSLSTIALQLAAQPELRHWSYRYPRLGRLLLPIAYTAALPLTPLIAGANHAGTIARWCAIMTASAVITASMFLVLQMSISLG